VRLSGKVAIITGAGQGIGLAYAERFLAEWARVVVAEIDAERGAAAADWLAASGEVAFVPTDITDEASAQECVERTVSRFGTVDVLLNNAALYHDIDNSDSSYKYLRHVFEVNLHGAWVMARAAAPVMVAKRWGRIINQGSIAAYLYEAPARAEFGVTLTEATKKVIPQKVQEQVVKSSAVKRPLDPEDLTGVAVFFASDDSRMVTGQVLCVDGGLCMLG
jgi:3-oxoacyl-[acyl-carrier protein] reductase